MTKANISQTKIVTEYVNSGKFDVVTFAKETGARIGTYGGLDLHKAFSEGLKRMRNGARFLVLQWPEEMQAKERYEAEKSYYSALPYVAKFSTDGRK